MKNSVLAVIPARGGSKGVPGKNLRNLLDVPLLAWAIRAAKKSKYIDRIVVTTDSGEIAKCAENEKVSVVIRPADLANDTCPTMPVIQHALNEMNKRDGIVYNVLVLLEPTSPFRSAGVVDSCIKQLISGRYNSVATVVQLERNPYNIFIVSGNSEKDSEAKRLIEPSNGKGYTQRQQMTNLKRINGCVYTTFSERILKEEMLMSYPIGLVEMTQDESVNIDSVTDFQLAEILAKRFQEVVL